MKRVFFSLVLAVLTGCESIPETLPPKPPETRSREVDYSTWVVVTEKPYEVPKPWLCDIITTNVVSIDQGTENGAQPTSRGPHTDHAINVRVNPVGLEAFRARTLVPVGTVVVKEKMTGGKVVAVGTMTKREPGYDPEYGDWEYAYRELKADAPPPTTGKIESCIACHRIAAKKDFMFRTYLPHK